MPKVTVKDSAVDALCHGANLAVLGIAEVDKNIGKGEIVAIMTEKMEAAGIGKMLMSVREIDIAKKGIAIDMERVLMPHGAYPRIWKTAAKV